MSTRLDFAKLELMDALDLAVLIEAEAMERYRAFSARLGHRFPGDPASVFAKMAENEAKHGQELKQQRRALFGDTPARVSRDDLFSVEAPEEGAIRANMSVLQAFEVALSSEQKAYDFYDQALPAVVDPKIRALFVELRDEEKDHVRMVQEAIAALPPDAGELLELDEDETPSL